MTVPNFLKEDFSMDEKVGAVKKCIVASISLLHSHKEFKVS